MLSKSQIQEAISLAEEACKHGYAAQTEAGAHATNAWMEWLALHGHSLLQYAVRRVDTLENACADAQLRANRLACRLCPECEGSGMVRYLAYDESGMTGEENAVCHRCNGKGLPGAIGVGNEP